MLRRGSYPGSLLQTLDSLQYSLVTSQKVSFVLLDLCFLCVLFVMQLQTEGTRQCCTVKALPFDFECCALTKILSK